MPLLLNSSFVLRTTALLATAALVAACALSDSQRGSQPIPERTLRALESHALTGESLSYSRNRNSLAFSVSWAAPEEVRVPMKVKNGLPQIPCHVNGHEVWMVLDTGSQTCVLEAETALQCAVPTIARALAETAVRGTHGQEPALAGVPDTIAIGDWQWHRLPCLVRTHRNSLPGPWIFSQQPVPFNLLGMDVMKSMCSYITLDYQRSEVVFGFRKTFQPEPVTNASYQSLDFRGGLPFIKVSAGGNEWWSLLDTGSAAQLEIDPAIARLPGFSQKPAWSRAVRSGMGRSDQPPGRQIEQFVLPRLSLLGLELRNVDVLIVGDQAKLGSGLLKGLRLTLDLQRSRLWLY